jgi:hypothetical protein
MQDMTELKVWKASDEHIPPETLVREAHELAAPGTQFTCFTGTEVQILTHAELRARQASGRAAGRAQVPHMHALHSVYLLYRYKSTCTDVISGELRLGPKCRIRTRYMRGDGSSDIVSTNGQVLSLLALLAQTCTSTLLQLVTRGGDVLSVRVVLGLLALLVQKYKY